jgi:hypothetical protein
MLEVPALFGMFCPFTVTVHSIRWASLITARIGTVPFSKAPSGGLNELNWGARGKRVTVTVVGVYVLFGSVAVTLIV